MLLKKNKKKKKPTVTRKQHKQIKMERKENARNYHRAAFFGESTCSGLAQMCPDPSSCSPVQQAQTDSLEWR